MNTVQLEIDGKTIEAEEGKTILQAARDNGITIPTLCHNDSLKASGVCRMCMVEVTKGKRTRLVASCVYQVAHNLVVKTNTEKVKKIRGMIIELLWPTLSSLAKEYGITRSRFVPERTDCNLCGQCVRYCAEVKKKNAVFFKGRGIKRQVAVVPELMNECVYCRECFDLCPGGWIVDQCDGAYVSAQK